MSLNPITEELEHLYFQYFTWCDDEQSGVPPSWKPSGASDCNATRIIPAPSLLDGSGPLPKATFSSSSMLRLANPSSPDLAALVVTPELLSQPFASGPEPI